MKSYVEECSFFEGNNPEEIARTYGTPVYVYNERIIRDRMRTVAGMITKYPFTANFSMKANSNLSILKIALEEGVNCDAMSEGEIRMLEKAGFPYDRIFFVPNNVSEDEMRYAIERGVKVSDDTVPGGAMYGRLNPGGEVSLRLNPGVGAGHHEKVVTGGKKTKFGIAPEDVCKVDEIAKRYRITIAGINQHVGSLFMEGKPYQEAVSNILEEAKNFPDLTYIDFGGGFGIPYHKLDDQPSFNMQELHDGLEPILDKFVEEYGRTVQFKSEPGRYCVAEGCVILGRVHATKQNAGHQYAGTDIGMNVLARPTLYDSWHDIEVLRDGKAVYDGAREAVTVTGNICESGDVLCKDRELPVIEDNDLVCVLDAGAYGYSMAYTYNSRPRPAEVMICEDGSVKVIRRKETYEDLLALY